MYAEERPQTKSTPLEHSRLSAASPRALQTCGQFSLSGRPCRSSGSEVHPCRERVSTATLAQAPRASELASLPRSPRAQWGDGGGRGPGRALGCGEPDGRERGSPSRPRRSRDGAVYWSVAGCTPSWGSASGPTCLHCGRTSRRGPSPGEARHLEGWGQSPAGEGPAGGQGRERRLTGELWGALSAPQRSLGPCPHS